jgi:hypothetical protein
VDVDRLIRRHPLLYHMASYGSWPSIQRHGLRSTSALLDLFEVTGEERSVIESEWRASSLEVAHPVHGIAVIRDQAPLRPGHLSKRLTGGMTPSDWYRLLNGHVFFWVDEDRLETFLQARNYRTNPQTVIVLDTAKLLERRLPDVRLSSINSGSLVRGGALRGPDTFQTVAMHNATRLVELCVVGSVPDVGELVRSVDHRWPDGRREQLFPEGARVASKMRPGQTPR